MAQIQAHDYETVSAVCDHCRSLCVFNRIIDIGEPGPYSGRDVTCLECGEEFWIMGDIINQPYELFIMAAGEHYQAKRYMLYVASLAQAWEMFFSEFAYSNFLYRPYFTNGAPYEQRNLFNQLSADLDKIIGGFTFDSIRNVVVSTVVNGVHPQTLQESETAIPRIRDEKFGSRVGKALVSAVPDPEIRQILLQLQELQVGELRNRVVHKEAHRPRLEEVERCHQEIGLLYRSKHLLDIRPFEWWRAGLGF